MNALMENHQRDKYDHRRRDQWPRDDPFKSQDDHQRDDGKNDAPPEPDLTAAPLFTVERGAARCQTVCIFLARIC
ncbi:MAG TPA: hypothetical protein VHL99_12035 [Candidatus Binatia bacterium]|nr:hypothetical protein [Candidatus Binatia bacterium]